MRWLTRKLALIIAGVGGFVLGSRSGRKPYETLEQRLRQLREAPAVQDATATVSETADSVVGAVTDKSNETARSVRRRFRR